MSAEQQHLLVDLGRKIDQKINELIDFLTPKLLASEFNTPVSAGNSFDKVSVSQKVSGIRVMVTLDTGGGTFSLIRAKSGASQTTVTEIQNGGASLSANAEYIFDILVTNDEQVSFQYSLSAKLLTFKVYEIRAMTV